MLFEEYELSSDSEGCSLMRLPTGLDVRGTNCMPMGEELRGLLAALTGKLATLLPKAPLRSLSSASRLMSPSSSGPGKPYGLMRASCAKPGLDIGCCPSRKWLRLMNELRVLYSLRSVMGVKFGSRTALRPLTVRPRPDGPKKPPQALGDSPFPDA